MSDNTVRKDYKLLDVILEVIFNNDTKQIFISDVDLAVEQKLRPVKKGEKDNRVAVYDLTYTNNDAIEYLKSEDYIVELPPFYRLKYKGVLKLNGGGFESDYDETLKEKRRKSSLFRKQMESYTSTWQFQLTTLFIAIIGLVLGIFK